MSDVWVESFPGDPFEAIRWRDPEYVKQGKPRPPIAWTKWRSMAREEAGPWDNDWPIEQDVLIREGDEALYAQAMRAVIDAGQASVPVIQRRLRIGYGRAARLLDRLELDGIVGPAEGNRPRKVNIRSDV